MSYKFFIKQKLVQKSLDIELKGNFNFFLLEKAFTDIKLLYDLNPKKKVNIKADKYIYNRISYFFLVEKLTSYFNKKGIQVEASVPTSRLNQYPGDVDNSIKEKKPHKLLCFDEMGLKVIGYYIDLVSICSFLVSTIKQSNIISLTSCEKRIFFSQLKVHLYDVGVKSVPVVMLLGMLLGLIYSFQAYVPLAKLGAQDYLIKQVTVCFNREVSSFLMGIILSSRSSTAFAADIATMKITQEVNSLRNMSINPIIYLILPRVFAATLSAPILTMYCFLSALIGIIIMLNLVGYSTTFAFYSIKQSFIMVEFFCNLLKSLIYGYLIGIIGCYVGMSSVSESSKIGSFATRAVVLSIITLIFCDGFFTILFYYMGL